MAKASVVLIEDNAVFLGLLTAFLERTQPKRFTIAGSARSGEEGIAAVRQLEPTVVIVDLKLPGLSGLEVIQRLRAADHRLAIVALTSADPAAFRDAALGAGADGFVTKDRLSADLLPALRRALRVHQRPVALGGSTGG